MLQTLPWIFASVAAALLSGAVLLWVATRRPAAEAALPVEWRLSARPVFGGDERRMYRQLREALPHHVVLAKLPLVRFCQPNDPGEVRYWYELLGASHVSFAICSASGRVLAAIDLDSGRNGLRRSVQIKQSVLGACRVRYLRCSAEHMPSIPELQLLVPHSGAPTRGPQPAVTPAPADPGAGGTAPARRRERAALWRGSGFFHDSFFGNDAAREPGSTTRDEPPGGVASDGPPPPDERR